MERKIKLLLGGVGGIIATLSAGVSLAFAQVFNAPPGFENLSKITFTSAIPSILKLLLIVAFVVAFIFLIIGGIKWILSGGDKAAAESARGTLTAAIIGLIIVLLTWLIIAIIEQLFGISIISASVNIPPLFEP